MLEGSCAAAGAACSSKAANAATSLGLNTEIFDFGAMADHFQEMVQE